MMKDCQVCGMDKPEEIIDGRMKSGGWAWMCEECHERFGVGLGTGKGQLYRNVDGVKLAG